tara:strand:- start:101 stop:457 length:357 start_codon:yes stop_codon:yes gene_type:complete
VPSNDDDVREEERQVIQESYESGGRRGEIAIELLALRKEFGAFTAGAFFLFSFLAAAAPFRSLLIFSSSFLSSSSSSFPLSGSLFALFLQQSMASILPWTMASSFAYSDTMVLERQRQ